jgi:hypothetical protein
MNRQDAKYAKTKNEPQRTLQDAEEEKYREFL